MSDEAPWSAGTHSHITNQCVQVHLEIIHLDLAFQSSFDHSSLRMHIHIDMYIYIYILITYFDDDDDVVNQNLDLKMKHQ